jgi:hypothetical protein
MSWTIPMLGLKITLSSASFKLRLTGSSVGAVDVTVSLADGDYYQTLASGSGLIAHVVARLNAAEIAAGTDGVWSAAFGGAGQPHRASCRLTRVPGDPADIVKELREFTTGLQALLGMRFSAQDPTSGGDTAGATAYWDTYALGHVWTPYRQPLRDYTTPSYGGSYSSAGNGYDALIIDRTNTRREVVLENVPGGLVLSDIFTRLEGWRMVSGFTAYDVNAPLEVLWALYTGGGSASPNDTLRYYPDLDTPATYQDVSVEGADAILRPFSGGLGEEVIPSPNRWRLTFPFARRL